MNHFIVTINWRCAPYPGARRRYYTAEYVCSTIGTSEEAIRLVRCSMNFLADGTVDNITGTARITGHITQTSPARLTKFDRWDGLDPEDFIVLPNPS